MNSRTLSPLLSLCRMARHLVCIVAWLWVSGVVHAQDTSPVIVAGSKFPADAGPLFRVDGGERKFLIPQGYFRSRVAGYASKDAWWLEALWPDLTPWRENNPADDKEFHAPGGGRMIMEVGFGGKNMATFLNRLINENEPGDPGYGYKSPFNFPDDTTDKRIKGDQRYGLQPYYVDFNKVLVFLNRDRKVPIITLDEVAKSRWNDWFIRRDSAGTVSTLIRCDSREVADPPEAAITGRGIALVPHCEHKILLPKYNARVDISYRRVFLPQWQAIDDAVRALLTKFETTQP
ncbi:hypothetical protein ACFQAT_13095 [Undibacterium arcticum]|uniref:hypothetical protein n=1 Tax=Undibacterium arcticum TaxID=1762892 RepID=UPI00361D4CE1